MFLHYIDLSWRSIKRTPVISFLMVFAIAIGIGLTMTSLSVYHMMSMDPIPHKSGNIFYPQLNIMDDGNEWHSSDNLPYQLTYQDAINLYNADIPVLKSPSFRSGFSVHLNSPEVKPTMEPARLVNREFFTIFDRPFVYGAPWSRDSQDTHEYVVVISEKINDRLFAGKNSVGQHIYLDNNSYRIVGVSANWEHHVKYYDVNNGAFNVAEQLYIPFSIAPLEEIGTWGNMNGWKHENSKGYQGLLASERVWIQFWAQLNTMQEKQQFGDYLISYMDDQREKGRFNREVLEFKLRNVTEWLEYNKVVSEDNRILVGLSFMFLLVCVSNILGLLLAKFLKRAPEVGVRRALGASKRHIFAQHIVEVSVIGLAGGLLGIAIAQLGLWGVRVTNSYYGALANMDVSMLLTAPIIALTASFLAGIYPAWLVCRTQPAIYLKSQ
ncbi:ABC transporter ATP-binding protein [Alteromonas sp. 38]|uniref:ABC transporter permease n=1 Tax=Alteromonas TaxID=226 RepID=UPI0012F1A316|nr:MULTISPECIES: ABC transporter permease [Alteromonas]CAD5284428.1 ABC transporter ATP-binding protein [Alteromonas sp. 154]VXB43034.1 ABC transporter ATP-binding protein [Alteromonas sp. 38]